MCFIKKFSSKLKNLFKQQRIRSLKIIAKITNFRVLVIALLIIDTSSDT